MATKWKVVISMVYTWAYIWHSSILPLVSGKEDIAQGTSPSQARSKLLEQHSAGEKDLNVKDGSDSEWRQDLNEGEVIPDPQKSTESLLFEHLGINSDGTADTVSSYSNRVPTSPEGGEEDTSKGNRRRAVQEKACGTALLRGRRPSQEDRVLCTSELFLPLFGATGAITTKLGVYAVFDGHGGHEASAFAASALYEHLVFHFSQIVEDMQSSTAGSNLIEDEGLQSHATERQRGTTKTVGTLEGHSIENNLLQSRVQLQQPHGETPSGTVDGNEFGEMKGEDRKGGYLEKTTVDSAGEVDGYRVRQLLEEALSRTIFLIDSLFSMGASQHGLTGGTTACIALQTEDFLLVANLGDSKALFCETSGAVHGAAEANRRQRKRGSKVPRFYEDGFCPRDLTRDHRPDRGDERARIEAAGGFVSMLGDTARVNGQLAVSRSIGDIQFKQYGVIAEPEFTGWMKIPSHEIFLVIASDGVFEKMNSQDVCRVLNAVKSKIDVASVLDLDASSMRMPIPMPPSRESIPSTQEMKSSRTTIESETCVNSEVINGRVLCSSNKQLVQAEHGAELEFIASKGRASVEEMGTAQLMAQALVNAAVEMGSMDNVAAVVVALQAFPPIGELPSPLSFKIGSHLSSELQQTSLQQLNDGSVEKMYDSTPAPVREVVMVMKSDSDSQRWRNEHTNNISTQLMLCNHQIMSCYELLESLPRDKVLPLRNIMEESAFHENEKLLRASIFFSDFVFDSKTTVGVERSLDVYREHLVCTPRQSPDEESQEVCLRPEGFSRFLELIGSVPLDSQSLLPDGDISVDAVDQSVFGPYSIYHHRYMLKKNFARGAFGEVWLAVKTSTSADVEFEESQFGEMNSDTLNVFCTDGQEHCGTFGPGNLALNQSYSTQPKGEKSSLKYDETTYILKRILVERGERFYYSGLREKHFGEIFLNASLNRDGSLLESITREDRKGDEHIARYVESFEAVSEPGMWLVFKNEGRSLSSLLYVSDRADVKAGMDGVLTIVKPSPWWHWLKTTADGRKEMRNILKQLLLAVNSCHIRNITHRDIKPENMIVRERGARGVAGPQQIVGSSNFKMKLIDFGSAIDVFTLKHLYGPSGPSPAEQTVEYSPPEVLLGKHWLQLHADQAHVYDLWSVGVVMLELVLGTPHVFQISSRTQALLENRLKGWDIGAKETIYMLRVFLEMCILFPGMPPQKHYHTNTETLKEGRLASWECSEEAFMQQIKDRDPLGIGMPDKWAAHLVRRLLQWYPGDRISAKEALKHPYFRPSLQVD